MHHGSILIPLRPEDDPAPDAVGHAAADRRKTVQGPLREKLPVLLRGSVQKIRQRGKTAG